MGKAGVMRIIHPRVGLHVGKCLNCNSSVELRQPWLSEEPIVNDGWYLVRCTNPKCHNETGMEIKLDELYFVDFVIWSQESVHRENSKMIYLDQWRRCK